MDVHSNITMEREIAEMLKDKKESLALLTTDLDDFKSINNSCGHYTGDRVLTQTVAALEGVSGRHKIADRPGGNKFIACTSYQGESRMEEKCREFLKHLDAQMIKAKVPLSTISTGIAVRRNEDDPTTLYQRTDEGPYTVKNNDKSSFRIES